MSSLLVKNALAIVTVDDEDRILKNESILPCMKSGKAWMRTASFTAV